jgi:hypothetical protein
VCIGEFRIYVRVLNLNFKLIKKNEYIDKGGFGFIL